MKKFKIHFQPVSDPFAFTLTDDVKSVDEAILGTIVLQSQTCLSDYITILTPGLVSNGVRTALPGDRFCGMGIGVINSENFFHLLKNNSILKILGANFNVQVVTDSNENPDLGNRGFYLIYSQGECFP